MKKFDKIMIGVINLTFFLFLCASTGAFVLKALPETKIKLFPLVMAIAMLIVAIKYAFDNFPINKEKGEGGEEA